MSLQKNPGKRHLTAVGMVLLSALLAGCDEGVAQNAAPQAPAVSAAEVVVKSISQWDSFNGRIEAVESVQLRPRVSGYIDKVNYTDGQEVKKGRCYSPLTIEPIARRWNRRRPPRRERKRKPARRAVKQNRTDKLINTNLVSREEWEQRRSAAVRGASGYSRRPGRRLMPRSLIWISPK